MKKIGEYNGKVYEKDRITLVYSILSFSIFGNAI